MLSLGMLSVLARRSSSPFAFYPPAGARLLLLYWSHFTTAVTCRKLGYRNPNRNRAERSRPARSASNEAFALRSRREWLPIWPDNATRLVRSSESTLWRKAQTSYLLPRKSMA
jgi:hypothetical protein